MKLINGLLCGAMCCLSLSGAARAADNQDGLNTLYGGDMNACLNNLNLLKTFSQDAYTRQTASLNAEISRATHYLMVRGQLTKDMQSVMDSSYQARLTMRCQTIHNALFDALIGTADGGNSGAMTARGGA